MAKGRGDFCFIVSSSKTQNNSKQKKMQKEQAKKKNLKHIMQFGRNYLKYTSNVKHKKDETT